MFSKGTRVDGVYHRRPGKGPDRQKFDKISFEEVLDKTKVMDSQLLLMCRDNNMPLVVFDMNKTGNLNKLIDGDTIGTLVNQLTRLLSCRSILLFCL